jgi:hypothetical protein
MTIENRDNLGIKVNLVGGLGNQLHGLAAGWATAAWRNWNLGLVTSEIPFGSNPRRRFELTQFDLSGFRKGPIIREELNLPNLKYYPLNRTLVWLMKQFGAGGNASKNVYFESDKNPLEQIEIIPPSSILTGHFLDFEWAQLAAARGFPTHLMPKNSGHNFLRLKSELNFDYPALHLRLGDYLQLKKLFPIASEAYYRIALSRINVGKFPYTIFTDDVASAKRLFSDLIKDADRILGPNEGLTALETMALISYHRRIVTATSTFSSWAAWFGSNGGAEVVTPVPHLWGKWQDQLPKDWIRFNLLTEAFEN